jgi:drug/metabolite transporter (DMT)-like permease
MNSPFPAFFQRRRCAACLLLLAMLFWAGNVVVARACSGHLPPLWLTVARWSLASLLLCPLAAPALLCQRHALWACRWRLLWLAAVGSAGNNALIYLGVAQSGATSAAALQTLTPVWIVLWSSRSCRLPWATWAGVALAGVGALLIAVHGDLLHAGVALQGSGGLWLLAASICWASYTMSVLRLPAGLDAGALLALQAVLGAVLLLPLAWWLEPQGLAVQLSASDWLALAYLGVFPSVLAYSFYRRAAQQLGAALAGNCMNLLPPLSALLSMAFLGERLQGFHVFGFVAIMLGLALGSGLNWRMPRLVSGAVAQGKV